MADRRDNDTGQGNMQNSQKDGRKDENRGGFGASSGRDRENSGRDRDSSGRDMRDDRSGDGSSRR